MKRINPNDSKQEIPKHFDYIEKARELTFDWAKIRDINLIRIEFVVPFVLSDKSLTVWLIFDTDDRVKKYDKEGIIRKVMDKYLDSLREINYPSEFLGRPKYKT